MENLEMNVTTVHQASEASFNTIIGRLEELEVDRTRTLQSFKEIGIDFNIILRRVEELEVSMTRVLELNESQSGEFKEDESSNKINELLGENSSNINITLVEGKNGSKLENKKLGTRSLNLKKDCQQKEYTMSVFISNVRRKWVYYILCAAVYMSCVFASVFYIKAAYTKWQTSPVVTSTSNNYLRSQDIPFPAVTICYPDRLRNDYNYSNNLKDCMHCEDTDCKLMNESCDTTKMVTLMLANKVCSGLEILDIYFSKVRGLTKVIDGEELDTYMERLIPPCDEDRVWWSESYNQNMMVNKRCGDEFQQFLSLSPDRVCMTFNSLRHSDIYDDNVVTPLPRSNQSERNVSGNPIWSFDNMFTEFKGSRGSVPHYDYNRIFFVFPRQEDIKERFCKYNKRSSASVIVHSPNEIPFDSEQTLKLFIYENTTLKIDLDPKITLASEDILRYTPKQRGCYFANENTLTMFKFYTKAHCELECLVNTMIDVHGCVPYYYPRPNSSVKVCTYYIIQPPYFCGCLPSCNFISYEIKTKEVAIPWNSTKAEIAVRFVWTSLYYTDIRYSINSRAEFLAFSLGILGGFLGVNVTCVWHLVYSRIEKLISSAKQCEKKKISPD